MSRHESQSQAFKTTDALAAQIAAIRDECEHAVQTLSRRKSLNDATLAECVRLGDSLERTNRTLRSAVAQIAIARRKREHSDAWIN